MGVRHRIRRDEANCRSNRRGHDHIDNPCPHPGAGLFLPFEEACISEGNACEKWIVKLAVAGLQYGGHSGEISVQRSWHILRDSRSANLTFARVPLFAGWPLSTTVLYTWYLPAKRWMRSVRTMLICVHEQLLKVVIAPCMQSVLWDVATRSDQIQVQEVISQNWRGEP